MHFWKKAVHFRKKAVHFLKKAMYFWKKAMRYAHIRVDDQEKVVEKSCSATSGAHLSVPLERCNPLTFSASVPGATVFPFSPSRAHGHGRGRAREKGEAVKQPQSLFEFAKLQDGLSPSLSCCRIQAATVMPRWVLKAALKVL